MPISNYLRTLREKVGSDLLVMPGVSMACFDEQRRLLLADHGGKKGWAIPGGSVDPEDLPAGAATREMREEAGLQVEPLRITGVYGGHNFCTTYPNGDRVDYKDTVFECRIVGGHLRADGEEVSALEFFSRSEMAQMKLPAWMREILPHLYSEDKRTFFQTVTWSPPADGVRKGGVSKQIEHLRTKIGREQLVMPAAVGIVCDARNRILMQHRSDNGLWSLPGGAIDPYETPVDAVVREIWEETGVLARPTQVAGVFGGPEAHLSYPNGDRVAIYSFVFQCQTISGTPSSDGSETLEARWCSPREITSLPMAPRWRRRLPLLLKAESSGAYFDPVQQSA